MDRSLLAAALPPEGLILDPFAGTGRVGTLAVARGDRFFGIEAHPLTAELARLKFERPGEAPELRVVGREVLSRAQESRVRMPLASEHGLLRQSIDADALALLAALRDAAESAYIWQRHVELAVLGTLRDVAGSRWPRKQPVSRAGPASISAEFTRRIDRMADDLATAPRNPDAHFVHGDARRIETWNLPPASVDASISSPPYLNQLAYAEHPRLELYFLRRAETWADLRDRGALLARSCVQQVKVADAQLSRERLSAWPRTLEFIETLCHRLRHEQSKRRQPKRYDLLLPAYFHDIATVLQNLRRVLRPGGTVAWVIGASAPYGVQIDGPGLVASLALETGYRVDAQEILGLRGARWPGVGQRHRYLLDERLVVMSRPAAGRQTAFDIA